MNWKNLLLAFAASAVGAAAQAADGGPGTGFYVGAQGGFAHYNFSNVSNNGQFGGGGYAGFLFTPNLAVEASYNSLGGFDGEGANTGLTAKGSGFDVGLAVYLPIGSNSLQVYAKLGVSSTTLKLSVNGSAPAGVVLVTDSYDKTSVATSLGLVYFVHSNVGLRAALNVYPVGGAQNDNGFNSGYALTGTVGAEFHF